MKFRFLRASLCVVGLLAMGMVALRAADDKTKAKAGEEVPPSPGTIKFTAAPAAVQKTFKDETNNARIELLGRGKSDDKDPDEKAIFRAIVGINDSNYDLIISGEGQVLSKILQPIASEVKLEDCPAAVQKALQVEAKGAKVEGINKVTAGKRADFIVDVTIKKQSYQLTFTDDGTLLSKVFDDGSSDSDDANATPSSASDRKDVKKTK